MNDQPINHARLGKVLLKLADDDATALVALRTVQKMLGAAGLTTADLVVRSASLCASCSEASTEGHLLLFPAPLVLRLPQEMASLSGQVASVLSDALTVAAGRPLLIKTLAGAEDCQVVAQVQGLQDTCIWKGERSKATLLAAALRPAITQLNEQRKAP